MTLETRDIANIGPHDPAKADRAPPPEVTRPANPSALETRHPAKSSTSRPSEPRCRHRDRLIDGHEPLLQPGQDRRHPQQLRLNLTEPLVPPPPFSRRRSRPPRLHRDLGIHPRRQLRDDVGGLVPPDPQLRRQLTEPTHRLYASAFDRGLKPCLLYTSPSPRDRTRSRMPSSA